MTKSASEAKTKTKQPLINRTVTKQSRMEKENNQHPGSRDKDDNYAPAYLRDYDTSTD